MTSTSPLLALLIAFSVVALLAVLLRWGFSHGHSLVAAPGRSGGVGDYGLLVAVAEPGTFVEAELIRVRLVDAGLRATLAPTLDGPRVMVFERDRSRALAVLAAPSP